MAQRIDVSEAKPYLAEMGIDWDQYFWNERAAGCRSNMMVLSDPLIRELTDPMEDAASIASQGLFNAYKIQGVYWVRRQAPKLDVLAKYLSLLLAHGLFHGRTVLLLPTNWVSIDLLPDQWELSSTGSTQGLVALLSRTLGDSGDTSDNGQVFGIVCELPEDIQAITSIASLYLHDEGRNCYIFQKPSLKIVICHEKDIHVCCGDQMVMNYARELANDLKLVVAPFDTQQCH